MVNKPKLVSNTLEKFISAAAKLLDFFLLPDTISFPQANLSADVEERISLLELSQGIAKGRSGFNNWVSTTKSACIV